jgi:hypothetical protein
MSSRLCGLSVELLVMSSGPYGLSLELYRLSKMLCLSQVGPVLLSSVARRSLGNRWEVRGSGFWVRCRGGSRVPALLQKALGGRVVVRFWLGKASQLKRLLQDQDQ